MGYQNLQNEILTLESLKHGLQYVKIAILEGISKEDEIIKRTGLTRGELFRVKELLQTDNLSSQSILYVIDQKTSELDEKIRELKYDLFQTYTLYIFYNWRKGLKVRWPGIYRGRNIRTVSKNMILLISRKTVNWNDVAGRDCIGLIGNGIYYAEFIPEDVNETVNFYLPIHGVLITKKLLDEFAASPPRIVGKYEKMHKELISRIPLSPLIKDEVMKNYLKNILISTLLKTKDIYEKFLEVIRENANKGVDEDKLSFISALPEFYNKILVTSKHYESLMDVPSGSISAPGLGGYEGKLETLSDFLKNISLTEVTEEVQKSAMMIVNEGWRLLTSLI